MVSGDGGWEHVSRSPIPSEATQLPQEQQPSTTIVFRIRFNLYVVNRSSVGHVLYVAARIPLHVKHDTTSTGRDMRIEHASQCRAIAPLMPSGLEGLIWGSTAGSIHADGESTAFSDCVVFRPASCNKMPQRSFRVARVDDCHSGPDRGNWKIMIPLLAILKDGECGEADM
jgi:hypothetical protein